MINYHSKVPTLVTRHCVTEVQIMWDALTVAHLFKPNTKDWNENFIWYVFDTRTNQILNTPLLPYIRVNNFLYY